MKFVVGTPVDDRAVVVEVYCTVSGMHSVVVLRVLASEVVLH